jgi:hypothetical protein
MFFPASQPKLQAIDDRPTGGDCGENGVELGRGKHSTEGLSNRWVPPGPGEVPSRWTPGAPE